MKKNKQYDVIVVGGGISGLSAAYHLLKAGFSVLTLEAGSGKENASFASDAIMSRDPDAKWDLILSKFGRDDARLVYEIGEKGVKLLQAFAKTIKPHFDAERLPAYIFANSKEKSKKLFKQYQLYKKIGIPSTYTKEGSRLHMNFDSYITVPNEGQTNNQAILKNLEHAIRLKKGQILKHTEVSKVDVHTKEVIVTTKNGNIFSGKEMIVATGGIPTFLNLPLPIEEKRTFVIEYRKHRMPELYTSSVLWDNEYPYHYIRSFRKFILWVGGGDIYEKDYNPKKDYFKNVDIFSRKLLLLDKSFERKKEWSGVFYPTKRGLPYIGKIPGKPIWLNIGFGGTGIVMTFVSGYLIASWKKGKEKKYQKLFSIDQ